MRLLTTTAVLALLAAPASAGGSHECQGGHNCNTGSTPSSTTNTNTNQSLNANLNYNRASSASVARSSSRSNARATGGAGGNATAAGGRSSATGGSASTGPVTVTNSYTGAAGDPAGGYSGSTTNIDARSAPSVLVPSVGGGGTDCPVVGFGVGGSGLAGGGGFGPSWISSDCNARKLAAMLQHMGYGNAAIALLEDHFPEVRRAIQATASAPVAQAAPVALAVTNVATVPAPAWCKRARPTTDASRAYVASVCGR